MLRFACARPETLDGRLVPERAVFRDQIEIEWLPRWPGTGRINDAPEPSICSRLIEGGDSVAAAADG